MVWTVEVAADSMGPKLGLLGPVMDYWGLLGLIGMGRHP